MSTDDVANPLRSLPAVHKLLEHPALERLIEEHGRETVLTWVRRELDVSREELHAQDRCDSPEDVLQQVVERISARADCVEKNRLGPVINATGVILHTGLGRAPLSQAARKALADIAGAGNIEIDLETTKRRYRGFQLQAAFSALTGCEDSLVVNNNAAATLLTLQSLCAGREVLISRGELIEIGGSFRLPEIFETSGAALREVGTTNRTKLSDYERACSDQTAAVMRVHPSNYRIIGFTESPGLSAPTQLAQARGLMMIDDIGSGCLIDVAKYGLPEEPTFSESIHAGADVVLGSGDKLLGGPQAGIILGRAEYIDRIRRHPLARAVRIGKLTLSALAATLDSYLRDAAEEEIPVIRLLAATPSELMERARAICRDVEPSHLLSIEVRRAAAVVGGGSLPGVELPTAVLSLRHSRISADELARRLRLGSIRLFGRLQQETVLLDLRSVLPEDDSRIALALRLLDAGLRNPAHSDPEHPRAAERS